MKLRTICCLLALTLTYLAGTSVGALGAELSPLGDQKGEMMASFEKNSFINRAKDVLVEEMGPPAREEHFSLTQGMHEFRIELLNLFSIEQIASEKPEITELHWRDGDYWITVWFHKMDGEWISIDAARWHKDTNF